MTGFGVNSTSFAWSFAPITRWPLHHARASKTAVPFRASVQQARANPPPHPLVATLQAAAPVWPLKKRGVS